MAVSGGQKEAAIAAGDKGFAFGKETLELAPRAVVLPFDRPQEWCVKDDMADDAVRRAGSSAVKCAQCRDQAVSHMVAKRILNRERIGGVDVMAPEAARGLEPCHERIVYRQHEGAAGAGDIARQHQDVQRRDAGKHAHAEIVTVLAGATFMPGQAFRIEAPHIGKYRRRVIEDHVGDMPVRPPDNESVGGVDLRINREIATPIAPRATGPHARRAIGRTV